MTGVVRHESPDDPPVRGCRSSEATAYDAACCWMWRFSGRGWWTSSGSCLRKWVTPEPRGAVAPDVVAELAHEGVAVAVAVLLLRRRRVGAPALGAAVEHRGLGSAQQEMSALSTQSGRPGAGRRRSTGAAAWQRLFLARCLAGGPANGPIKPWTSAKPGRASKTRIFGAKRQLALFGARNRPGTRRLRRGTVTGVSRSPSNLLLCSKQPRKNRHRAYAEAR